MRLVIADADNSPASRMPDVILIRVVPESCTAWVWSELLTSADRKTERFLLNSDPPYGTLPATLSRLDWKQAYQGLAIFSLPLATFQLHLGSVTTYFGSADLNSGQTLRAVLDSAMQAEPVNLNVLSEIARMASEGAFQLSEVPDLRDHLDAIVVPSRSIDEPAKSPQSSLRGSEVDQLLTSRRLSIWTPGASEVEFTGFYSPLIGRTEAERLWAVSRAAVGAVAAGDFEKQVDLAGELAKSVPDTSVLAGEAAYFRAEGLRLLADLDPNQVKKDELRAEAVREYQVARDRLKDDPRPLRGIGRISELKGDFDGALNYFKTAKGLCLTESSRDSIVPKLDLAHEVLRTTRHFIHCLLDIRSTSASSAWHRHDKERELEGHLQECENLHYEIMPTFQSEPEWFYIEWFMGFVFLGKAWGALGNYPRMQASLTRALEARRHIMRPAAGLTAVERANLEWWLAVSRGLGNVFDADFAHRVDKLDSALRSTESAAVGVAVDDILRRFAAPWGGDTKLLVL